MTFLSFIWKNLSRRPVRLALTTIGLALAVGAIVSLVGLADGFERSFSDLYRRRGVDLVVHHSGGVMQLTRGVDENLGQRIAKVAGVKRVISALTDVIALEKFDLFAVLINGLAPDSQLFERITMVSGRQLRADDRGRMIIGKILAANTSKAVGDTLDVYGETFEVIGVFESFSVYENGAIFVLLDELQRLTGRHGQVSAYLVETDHPDDSQFLARVSEQVVKLDTSLAVTPTAEFVRNVSQIKVARAAAWITSTIAILIGVAGTLNTMLMSVFERVQEIGTLRAIGWRKPRVVAMVLCESLIVSSLGAAVGILIGLLAIRWMAHWPGAAGLVEGTPPATVLLKGCLAALVAGILGAVYPAYWAARLSPVEAMRAK